MEHELRFQENISCWESGLPLGNGETGCLIWGSPAHLRFSLDRTDIWDTTSVPGTDCPEFTYQNLARLAKEGDNDEIRRIFDSPYHCPLPTKLPAGKIILAFDGYEKICSCLRLSDGEAELVLESDGTEKDSTEKDRAKVDGAEKGGAEKDGAEKDRAESRRIRSIVHATKGIGMISVDMPRALFSVELQSPEFGRLSDREREPAEQKKGISHGSLKSVFYEEPVRYRKECGNDCHLEAFEQKISEDFSYGIVMAVQEKDGKTNILYRIFTSPEESLSQACEHVLALLEAGYDGLLQEHRDWWKGFWDKSSISLPDKFMEKNWYISNYLLAGCSREGCYPMPLQGVWTADEDALPPWKGDYHNDLNTQMSYYHYLKANHLEQGKSFVDFLWNRREAARAFARNFYGTGGLCLPSVMSIDGKPLGGWPMYSLSPVNQMWLCKAFDDYYRYTGDESFLKERAYPYFRETAECIGALLEEGEDGLLRFPISSSPEVHDDELEAFVTPNSNYDLAFLHYFYDTLCGYAEKLLSVESCTEKRETLEREDRAWRSVRGKLPALAVDERGVLMLAPDEALQESHRHHSHAQAIHPLRLVKYDTAEHRRIIEATIRNLEELGTDMWVGFSFCWMAELYAIACKGEKAAGQLGIFWRNFCSPNGFHLNGDQKAEGYSSFTYHPFTLEANMCAADALQEMLLYGEEGVIEVFPAIPESWERQEVAFQGFRTEGGILVSARLSRGKLTELLLEAPQPMRVKLKGWSHEGERRETESCEVDLHQGENVWL